MISSTFYNLPEKVANVCKMGNVNREKLGILKRGEESISCQGRKESFIEKVGFDFNLKLGEEKEVAMNSKQHIVYEQSLKVGSLCGVSRAQGNKFIQLEGRCV